MYGWTNAETWAAASLFDNDFRLNRRKDRMFALAYDGAADNDTRRSGYAVLLEKALRQRLDEGDGSFDLNARRVDWADLAGTWMTDEAIGEYEREREHEARALIDFDHEQYS